MARVMPKKANKSLAKKPAPFKSNVKKVSAQNTKRPR